MQPHFLRNCILSFTVMACALLSCAGGLARAAVISVNFMQYASRTVNGAYGLTNQGSVADGWVNLNQVNNSNSLPFSNGTNSTMNFSGSAPGWASGNAAYAGTPQTTNFRSRFYRVRLGP